MRISTLLSAALLVALLCSCAAAPTPPLTLDDFQYVILNPLASDRAQELLRSVQNDAYARFDLNEWEIALGRRDAHSQNIYPGLVKRLRELGVPESTAPPAVLVDPQAQANTETRKALLKTFIGWLWMQDDPVKQKLRQLLIQSAKVYSDPAHEVFAVCVAGKLKTYQVINETFFELLYFVAEDEPFQQPRILTRTSKKREESCPEEKITL